jgi:hypothetical protein
LATLISPVLKGSFEGKTTFAKLIRLGLGWENGGSHQSITEEHKSHSDLTSNSARRADDSKSLNGYNMASIKYLFE